MWAHTCLHLQETSASICTHQGINSQTNKEKQHKLYSKCKTESNHSFKYYSLFQTFIQWTYVKFITRDGKVNVFITLRFSEISQNFLLTFYKWHHQIISQYRLLWWEFIYLWEEMVLYGLLIYLCANCFIQASVCEIISPFS